jgi:hypothetical protein
VCDTCGTHNAWGCFGNMTSKKSILGLALAIAVTTTGLTANAALNASITGTASGGRSAEADMTLNGSLLTIDLKNTGVAAGNASQLLLGLFFDTPGATLTPVLGVSTPNGFEPGFSTLQGTSGNFGEGWAFHTSSAFGHTEGIAGSGAAGDMGPNGNFASPGVALDGSAYGIANGLSNPNGSINAPIAHTDAIFQLNVTGTLDFIAFADSLVFQWGTSLTEGAGGPGLPPQGNLPDGGTSVLLLGTALSGLVWARRKVN